MKSLNEFNNYFILFLKYARVIIKSQFQYKLNAFLLSFAVFFRELGGIIIIYFTLTKFDNLGGWNLNELMFLVSFLFISYSILIVFFTGFRDFHELVRMGTFDRYLLRPVGIFFQIISSKADYFAAVGHGTLGILLFVFTANSVGITWSVSKVLYCILAIISGVLIQASIFIMFSCASFWTVKTTNLMDFIFYNTRKVAGYPISIFPGFIQKILIYVVPFAFVNYFPAQYFLNKADMGLFPHIYMYLAPIIAVILLIISSFIWRVSLKNYSSTGS